VFGWSNAAGGIHHYRIREPLRGLAIRGHITKSLPVATLEMFEQWHVVLVRGLHHPRNSLLWRWAAEARKPALRVYDLDDDIWAWNPDSDEDRYWTDQRRLEVELNIQAADLVTTPTIALAKILSELNPNVAVLPNTIPERIMRFFPQRRDKFIIGWQGAQQHIRDLQQIYSPVLRFMLRYSNVEFHLWGPQNIADFPEALQHRIVTHPWVQSVWAHYARLNMDVGLAPLDPTDPFNATKSDIRLREYAALGIPFIASNTPAYEATTNSARGMLAKTEDEWEHALVELYRNHNLRHWMSEQGRLRARLWTTEQNGIETERVYDRARAARDGIEQHEGTSIKRPRISQNGEGNYVREIDTKGKL
jgi:glycosyltransferase involved in cell wall biosynthesis